ncbi:hypothetical protein Pmani_037936 [Petrolisthes manimaculis]|uniref:receptor protein-tyrosine kinase n=1 Tax=Petrolisthes manimaculis TaxID=1843537 RepID=A0AAE1TMU4_9EUCA|nr:hypothetical protein Pmani_037936 [Petrolisthes manimaculis]
MLKCWSTFTSTLHTTDHTTPPPLLSRGRKYVLKEHAPRNESVYLRPEWASTSLGSLYLAVAAAATATVLVLTLAAVLYLRGKTNRTRGSLTCRYYSGPGYVGAGGTGGGQCWGRNHYVRRGTTFTQEQLLRHHRLLQKGPHLGHNPCGQMEVLVRGEGEVGVNPSTMPPPPSPRCTPSPTPQPTPSQPPDTPTPPAASWRDPRTMDHSEKARQLAIDRWKIEVGEVVAEGTFGRVHKGVYRDPYARAALTVILKTVTGEASSSQARLAVREGLLLAGLHHQHLLPVLGVCLTDPRHPLLLYPHLGLSNLKTYLLGCGRGSGEGGTKLLTRDVVHVAIQVCLGLIHLHHNRLLHKDVATRNCLIDSELQVRVSDTALSRDLFPRDYHCLGDNENRPVKWLSLEALVHKQFTPANDVWMFGVLLWELTTLGQQPYVEVDPFEMAGYLRDGYRLAQPNNCPDELFGMMARCWAPAPEDRATLPHLLSCLQDFYSALGKYI